MHRPFSSHDRVATVLPDPGLATDEAEADAVGAIRWLMQNAAASALSGELGATMDFVDAADEGPRFLVGPARLNPAMKGLPSVGPQLDFDRESSVLRVDGPTVGAIYEALDLLRSMDDDSATLRAEDCTSVDAAVDLVEREVGRTWPSFGLRGVDWAAVCAEHAPLVRKATDPPAAFQRWLAALGDGHTWVKPRAVQSWSPCETIVSGDQLLLWQVPKDSAAWRAGARPGHRMLGVDVTDWLSRTAATPQSLPLVVGRRALATPPGEERELEVEGPGGRRLRWIECPGLPPWDPLVSSRRLPSGAGYLRIRQWIGRPEALSALDEAMDRFRGAPGLVVDLRGNTGGNLAMASAFRDRFLRVGGPIGHLRYSDPSTPGQLTPKEPILAEPAPPERRWGGRVRFLTDGLTYSSSEDAMLGLAGRPHVEVIGEPSGGGSGRMRSLRLLPGWRLSISTALTYTLDGWCIEGGGVPVDRPMRVLRPDPSGEDRVLAAADEGW